jgi:amino acid transporter
MAAEFYAFNSGDPWGWMAEQVLPGLGGALVIFAILNSSVANANAGANAATRSIFSMGRSGLLPDWFAGVHPALRTPVNAVHAQAIVGLVVAIGLGLFLGDQLFPAPLMVYVFIGYSLGLLFAGMYIAVNIAAIGYYLRERRDEFNAVKHLVIPVLGIIAMVPAFMGVLGGVTIPFLGTEVPQLAQPFDMVPILVGAWMLVGIVLYFVMRRVRPEAIGQIGEAVTEA